MWPYNIPERFQKLSSGSLKMIAIVTMFIDHAAVALLLFPVLLPNAPIRRGTEMYDLLQIYRAMRFIGRVAFPIFCFFLAEGFFYTRNRLKYAARLLVFAFVAEIPFDLALEGGKLFSWDSQNTLFTLLFGFLAIWAFDYFSDKWYLQLPLVLACFAAARFCHTDYGWRGVLVIFVFYLLHNWRIPQLIAGFVALSFISGEFPGILLALPLLILYNGKRGRMPKYLFYAFYPGHLLLLYFLSRVISGGV